MYGSLQVYHARTAAAEKARQEAISSVGHMRAFVQQLLQQYPQLGLSTLQRVGAYVVTSS